MKKVALTTVLTLMSLLLTACGDHYDKDGHYVSYDTNGRTVIDTDGNKTYFSAQPPAKPEDDAPPAEAQ
jgi:hypothetical protein